MRIGLGLRLAQPKAASGGGGGQTAQRGPNLTPTSATYTTAATGFTQALNGGYGAAPAADGSDVIPNTNTWTYECRFKMAANPGGVQVMCGVSQKSWLGIASDGRLVGNYTDTAIGDQYFNGGSVSGGGTNPVVADNAWHHVAIVSNGASGVTLYLDGAKVGATNTNAARASAGNNQFALGALNPSGGFAFSGQVDEFASWTSAKYTAGFTAPSAPYTGAETNLKALYHCDGNLNAAVG